MPTIKISLIINRFKKGKKTRKDYLQPKEIYEDILNIEKPGVFIDVVLKSFSNEKHELPVRVCWNADKEIYCVAKRKNGNIRFILQTESITGKPITNFSVTGQTVPKSKFTNWSAHMKVLRRS